MLLAKTLSSTIFEQALIAIGTFGVIASAIFSCVYLSISPYVRDRGHRYLLWLGGQSNGDPERLDFCLQWRRMIYEKVYFDRATILHGRPVSTDTPTFALAPEQPAARGDVAPLGRPTYLRGRLRIIGLAGLRPLSL